MTPQLPEKDRELLSKAKRTHELLNKFSRGPSFINIEERYELRKLNDELNPIDINSVLFEIISRLQLALDKAVETLDAVIDIDPMLPNWTLEQERIGNNAAVIYCKKELQKILDGGE